jgi:hypothetical protein
LLSLSHKDKLMATISTNDIKIRYDIDLSKLQQATSEFDKITAEERQLLAELGKLKKQFDEVGDKAKKAGKDAGDSLGGIGQAVSKVGPVIAGIFAADKIIGFTKEVIAVTAEFQKLGAILKNTLGSNSAAQGALTRIQQFAAQTPFSVQELTASFVKLANQGFTPTNAQLRKLGDLASSTGKSFDQLTEAIIDAQTGEFERLKEFGIRASKAGDNVTFTFKGVQTQTKFTNDAIRQYILSLGDLEGVSGSMGAVSDTLGGQISNLGDAWDSLLNTIGTRLAPVFSGVLKLTARFLGALNDLFKGEEQKTKEFLGGQYTAYSEFFVKTSDDALKNIVKNSEKELVGLKQNTAKLKAELEKRELELTKAQAKSQDEKGSGFARQFQIRADAAQKAYDKAVRLETATTAMNQAAIDEINKRAKAAEAASASTEKQDKAAYQARLKVIELEKQQQVLMAQLRGSKLGEVGAERVFQEAVYQLKLEYSTKNIGIIEAEVRAAELQRDKALKDYNEAAEKEKLINKEAKVEIAKEDKNLYDNRLAQMKKWQKDYEKGLADEVEAKRKAEERKQEIQNKTFELAENVIFGAFEIYQNRLSAELSLLEKKYNREIELADGNQQKIDALNREKEQKEKELKLRQFKADQAASASRVLFTLAEQIMKYAVSNPPAAVLAGFIATAQLAIIAAQKPPEFAEGTKGKPFEGGKAIVGERGVEKVVTKSGKVYFTPNKASLVELPAGSQVIPNHALSRQELFLANHYANQSSSGGSPVVGEIRELGSILKSLPITQLSMDERGFEKFIRTPRRTTRILNNRFRTDSV